MKKLPTDTMATMVPSNDAPHEERPCPQPRIDLSNIPKVLQS